MQHHVTPDFLIIGAPKCGTTALSYFLGQHPQVFMTENKEPRYFTALKGDLETSITGNGPRHSGNYDKGPDWYTSLFKHASPNQLKAEASTVYFANQDAAALIKKHCPSVKLILMLRNPVVRLYSHYWQEHKLGFQFPTFEEMIQMNHLRFQYYDRISHYRIHLERYLQLFKKDNLKIIIQENFTDNPKVIFDDILSFLDLSNVNIDLNERKNDMAQPKNSNLSRWLQQSKKLPIDQILPGSLAQKVKKIGIRLIKSNQRKFSYPPLRQDLFKKMILRYEEDIVFVENLLSVNLSSWRILEEKNKANNLTKL
jgi:deoxyadenosine/deoxycytidine kinase